MPVIDRLPVPEPLRHITPGAPRPRPEQDPADHLPVIGPPATPRRISGQQPPQAIPLLIGQIMTIQQIKHRTDLHDPAAKIHGTRPRAAVGNDLWRDWHLQCGGVGLGTTHGRTDPSFDLVIQL